MATKKTGVSCYDKAHPDEPIFVLRAQDPMAAAIVRVWAVFAKEAGVRQEKIEDALNVATAMDAWPTKKEPD